MSKKCEIVKLNEQELRWCLYTGLSKHIEVAEYTLKHYKIKNGKLHSRTKCNQCKQSHLKSEAWWCKNPEETIKNQEDFVKELKRLENKIKRAIKKTIKKKAKK